jgi:3-dehydroquinate synthase
VLAFDWQSESLDLVALATLVSESCAIKAAIVASDEREQGVRKALNFGHTLGHALEAYSLTREPLYHGEAVALGMLGELSLAVQMGVCNSDLLTDLRCGLEKVGLPIKVPFKADLEKLYQLTKLDKKNVSSAVNFSLPEQLGKCRIDCSADRELILQVFGQLIA